MATRPRECRARVAAVRALAAEILEADLDMLEPPALAFEAGQWVSVPFGPKIVRAYSIASSPRAPARITLCADVAPGWIGSRWFHALAPGAEVGFKGPLGGFTLARDETRRLLFVAEEIGIVPVRSILANLYAVSGTREATLVYWARDPSWLVYGGELAALTRRPSGLTYRPVVREAPAGWDGERGDVAAVVDRVVDDVAGVVAYVAGGGGTIDRVRQVLMAKGMERKAVKWEKFW
ncbi:MAG: FAD-dependent oxidoreductase [Candidatus Rokubacteria bacterium]|nr:FAD-dependent oxidoreductase [Candidatus Rokubacteria bacterium]